MNTLYVIPDDVAREKGHGHLRVAARALCTRHATSVYFFKHGYSVNELTLAGHWIENRGIYTFQNHTWKGNAIDEMCKLAVDLLLILYYCKES